MLSTQQMTRGLSRPDRWIARQRRRDNGFDRSFTAVAELELPPAVFKTCPWQPRELIETGLRQWLRCCAAALRDDQLIGMPSLAVDEAWHGLILCTMRYQTFCTDAYGKFMHHHPVGGAPAYSPAATEPMAEQLRRTVIAWELVGKPGEECVLWDLDNRVGVDQPWGVDLALAAEIQAAVTKLRPSDRNCAATQSSEHGVKEPADEQSTYG